MDYYEVLFLHPNGNRFLLQGVQAEIENKHEFITSHLNGGYGHFGIHKKREPVRTWLEIRLSIASPVDQSAIDELKQQIEAETLFLYFKDVHPNLIKGIVTGIQKDQHTVYIEFKGNATNKTYEDFIIETQHQLDAYQFQWENKVPDESQDEGNVEPTKVKERIKVLKRKLTF